MRSASIRRMRNLLSSAGVLPHPILAISCVDQFKVSIFRLEQVLLCLYLAL